MSEVRKVSFWRIFWPALTATVVVSFIGWVITLSIIGGLVSEEEEVRERKVLHLTLSGNIGEVTDSKLNTPGFSVSTTTGLSDILFGFQTAAKDNSVKGIFLDIDNISCGYGTAHEIRDAIKQFRKSGKFVIAYLDGEVITQKQYYIASAAGEVYGFPTSAMEFMGIGSEMTYFKRTLDMLGVEVQIIRGSDNDFKSAVEPFFRENMSDSSRVQVERFLGRIWSDIRTEIAADRKTTPEALNEIAEYTKIQRVEDALKFKLIDGCKYRDEVVALVAKKAGGKPDMEKLMAFEKYAREKFKTEKLRHENGQANVAVILAEGDITVDGDELSSRKICKYFRELREAKNVKAVVFRINSGGGSALASEEIWREVTLTAKKMKVIVSMGDVAASGGYYIATPAHKIFAENNTITGSIGVFGMIPYTGKALEDKLGITFDRAQTNSHSVLSLNRKLTPEELQLVQNEVDQIYSQFRKRVSDGRKLSAEQVSRIARGRVWTGSDAINIGLVDKIGGLSDAIAYAVKEAGVKDPKIRYWPSVDNDPIGDLLEKLSEKESMKVRSENTLPNELLQHYQKLKQLENWKGMQMRLPMVFTID